MLIGIHDIDTKHEKMGHGKSEKFPNIACGQIYGYHKQRGDIVIHPWKGEHVDRLYVSAIFSWTKPTLERHLPMYEKAAGEVVIGGTGWDWRLKLPLEIEATDPRWTYELYGIDYGIGFTTRGCHVGCGFCVVPRKEGIKEYRTATIADLVNPSGNHVVLLNSSSFAEPGFFDDVAEIRERGLTVNWNQANDITLLTDKYAEALASVQYRNFNCTKPMLHFACDQLVKRKVDPVTREVVEYDMLRVVPEKVRLLSEHGIKPYHLTFYMLIGFDSDLEGDMARFNMLNGLGCNAYAMMYRDLSGKAGVDGRGKSQSAHVKPFRDWVNGHGFRNVRFENFDRWQRAQNHEGQRRFLA